MALGDTIARLAVSLSLDASEFSTGSTKAQRELGKLQATFKALGDKWMQTGRRLSIGVSAPLTAFGLMSAKAASDAQELDSAFSETFGNLTDEMRRWARETGDAMGRSTQAMQEMANTFGIFFNQAAPTRKEAAEMSKTFAVLAQDLSSFYNVSGEVALQKLRSGLSGESEPLRDFGVFLTEATVKAKALEMGLTGLGDELTEQEKIMARYALILEGTTNAQGDVARTSSGAANQWRSFTEALQELQVVIGERLLPVLTPLVKGMTRLVNGFNNLPSGVQTAIVAIGAMMAAIGPMMLVMGTLAATLLPLFAAKFGPIGLAISAFINPLGTAISFLAQFAVQLAGMTMLKTVGLMLLRFAGPLGLIASVGILIYQNWDKIAAVFAEFWAQAKEALGPPLQELIATISKAFAELWGGPLGDGIRGVMGIFGEFASVVRSALGQALIGVLKGLLNILLEVFRTIGDAIRVVNAILNRDWRGAWEAAIDMVSRLSPMLTGIVIVGVESVRRLYEGVRTWFYKLAQPFNWVADKLSWIGKLFFQLYDKVVGHSYIPDMVDGIAAEMARLDKVMVDPAAKAARKTSEIMRDMATEVRQLLDRLFPEIGAANRYRNDLALLEGSGLGASAKAEARRRLALESVGIDHSAPVDIRTKGGPLGGGIDKSLEDFSRTMDKWAKRSGEATIRVAKSFKDMATDTISALRRMTDAIKGGGFLDILEGIFGLGMQLGSIGVFGQKIADNINASVPGYATGTRSAAPGLAWVGERGPELVNFRGGERVWSNRESMALGGGVMEIRPSPLFDVYVDGKLVQAAPAMMQGGAQLAGSEASFAQSRRIGG